MLKLLYQHGRSVEPGKPEADSIAWCVVRGRGAGAMILRACHVLRIAMRIAGAAPKRLVAEVRLHLKRRHARRFGTAFYRHLSPFTG